MLWILCIMKGQVNAWGIARDAEQPKVEMNLVPNLLGADSACNHGSAVTF